MKTAIRSWGKYVPWLLELQAVTETCSRTGKGERRCYRFLLHRICCSVLVLLQLFPKICTVRLLVFKQIWLVLRNEFIGKSLCTCTLRKNGNKPMVTFKLHLCIRRRLPIKASGATDDAKGCWSQHRSLGETGGSKALIYIGWPFHYFSCLFNVETFELQTHATVQQVFWRHPVDAKLKKRREVTMFFSDIASFTTIVESIPPEKSLLMLSRYFQARDHGAGAAE